MPAQRFPDRQAWPVVCALLVVGVGACCFARHQVQETRRDLVSRRLSTAVDILREPAASALNSPESRPAFLAQMEDWGRVTGLRLTLILPDGSVLADTEVDRMPNLSDRPEVKAANAGSTQTEFRRSAVTGKDTLYVAKPVEKGGVRIGALRAATEASEVDAALSGFEWTFALIAFACLFAGAIVGFVTGRGGRGEREEVEEVSEEFERLAA
jgi:hypothetical protein